MNQSLLSSLPKVVLQSLGLFAFLMLCFFVLEPAVTRSASDTSEFTIRQEITSEISFLVEAADVTMVGAIGGIAGGHATGTTSAVVQTNSVGGYVMDISFENSPSMRGEVSGSESIRDYEEVGAEPDFNFIASTSAVFAYTVSASNTTDVDPSFTNNGTSACGSGTQSDGHCWKGPSTSDYRIIDRDTPAPLGATTTLTFIVNVPSNPIPSLEEDFYTATATLTATTQ